MVEGLGALVFVLFVALFISNLVWFATYDNKRVTHSEAEKYWQGQLQSLNDKHIKLLRVCTTLSATNKKLRKEAKPAKYTMVPVCPCGKPAEQKVEHGMEVMHFCDKCVEKLELENL